MYMAILIKVQKWLLENTGEVFEKEVVERAWEIITDDKFVSIDNAPEDMEYLDAHEVLEIMYKQKEKYEIEKMKSMLTNRLTISLEKDGMYGNSIKVTFDGTTVYNELL